MFPGDSADNLHLLSPIKEPTFIIEPAGFTVHSALSRVTVGLQRSKVSLVEEPGVMSGTGCRSGIHYLAKKRKPTSPKRPVGYTICSPQCKVSKY